MNPGLNGRTFTDLLIAPNLRPLKDVLVGDIGNTLWVLLGGVGLLMAIACTNVANLLLVRADGRRQELAIRAAIGAAWGRIARELLLESSLLGVAGGAFGLALAYAAVHALVASDLAQLPRIHDISSILQCWHLVLLFRLPRALSSALFQPSSMHALVSQARSVAMAVRSARAKRDTMRAVYWSSCRSPWRLSCWWHRG